MSGIVEFQGGASYPDAVVASFDADIVVVRDFVSEEVAEVIAQKMSAVKMQEVDGTTGAVVDLLIPKLSESKPVLRQAIQEKLPRKKFQMLGLAKTVQHLRRGEIGEHIDEPRLIAVTSVNLRNAQNPALYYAERICPVDSPTVAIRDTYAEKRSEIPSKLPKYQVELGVGDAVVMTRGVRHKVHAEYGRVALLTGTRIRRPI